MFLSPWRRQLLVFQFCLLSLSVFAQSSWHIGVGSSITRYDFVSSKGVPFDFLKRGSGSVYQVGYSNLLLDTISLSGQTSPKALFFLRNPKLAKVLSLFTYEGNVLLNQLNAVGDVQNIGFDYQTNYVGIQGVFGPSFRVKKGWSVGLSGNISLQKILQGNQHVNFSYVDLTQDPSFNTLQFFMGYGLKLQKQINPQIGFFVNYQTSETQKSIVSGQSNLNFKNENFQLGIRISTQK